MVYGVIADPVGHSHLSPQISQQAAYRHLGIDAVYVPFRVLRAENLDAFLTDAAELGIRGLSVTIPHKEAVIRKLSKVDPAVKRNRRHEHDCFRGRRASRPATPTSRRRWIASIKARCSRPDWDCGLIEGEHGVGAWLAGGGER